MRVRFKAAAIIVASLVLLSRHPAAAQPVSAFQINPGHAGGTVFPNGLRLPLEKVWSRKWPIIEGYINDVSYPLIVNGRVFVTVTPFGTSDPSGTLVYALSLQDGRVLWKRKFRADSHFSALAYDNGRLFAATGFGIVAALDPETGRLLWHQSIRDGRSWNFSSSPTAADGRIFVTGGGWSATLFALDQSTGKIIWKNRVLGRSSGSATVVGKSVFASYSDHVYKFDAATGKLRWYYNGKVSSAGTGQTAPYYAGRLYAKDAATFTTYSLDARTGKPKLAFDRVWKTPAFFGRVGYFITYFNGLIAWSTETDEILWQQFVGTEPAIPPIVVNGKVLAVSHGVILYVLNGRSGEILQELDLGSHVTPNGEGNGRMQKGMAAGEGMVVVSTDDMVFAFKPRAD